MDYIVSYFADFFLSFYHSISTLSCKVHPFYWLIYIVILVFIFYVRHENKRTSFLKWAFPKDIYIHPSAIMDIKLFFLGRTIIAMGLMVSLIAAPLIAVYVITFLTHIFGNSTVTDLGHQTSSIELFLMTLIITLSNDLGNYWNHRLAHQISFLWPFHAVHHSAEVMNPFTTYRTHPFYDFLGNSFLTPFNATAAGIIFYFINPNVDIIMLGGANALAVIFMALCGSFHHSHFWISYGNFLNHIIVSPALHQIHHSTNPKHFNKNYAGVFALWDWMFGTLYIPEKEEQLKFGIADKSGNLIPQPYPSLRDALFKPFIESAKAIVKLVRNEISVKPSRIIKESK